MARNSFPLSNFYLNPSIDDLNLDGLTDEERLRILNVVEKEQNIVYKKGSVAMKGQKMEGQLNKFTNLVKGWQFRWFVLDPEKGTLSYYLDKEKSRSRGILSLAGAVVSPSDEDSMTFTINGVNGDIFKLRGTDAKDRQHWINLIRAVAEFHTQNVSSSNPIVNNKSKKSPSLKHSSSLSLSKSPLNLSKSINTQISPKISNTPDNPIKDELKNINDAITSVIEFHSHAMEALQTAPNRDYIISPLDEQVLLFKATSQATVNILQQCYGILQKQSSDIHGSACTSQQISTGTTIKWIEPQNTQLERSVSLTSTDSCEFNTDSTVVCNDFKSIDQYMDEETEDEIDLTNCNVEDMDSNKSIILNLLSQLKLGMDLTRVVLPTFVLEKRSLLEMYADFFNHTDIFLNIADGQTPEDRMLAVVDFYLTSFHVGRQSSVAKKPYNPILKEHFHCSYKVASSHQTLLDDEDANKSLNKEASKVENQAVTDSQEYHYLNFLAEQVSHHPPISAFYAECKSKSISMNTHIWTKSKFYGMSVGVVNVGEGVINLPLHDEEYVLTFPNAFCRSILTVPWMELGGRTYIRCPQTGYNATILFHTKPFYGNKQNYITFEVKNAEQIICRGEGYWDGQIVFNYSSPHSKNGESRVLDVASLPVTKKMVRKIEKQSEFESRKLWQHVTSALRKNDLEVATSEKYKLEEQQRKEKQQRLSSGIEWKPQFFQKHMDGWSFNPQLANVRRRRLKSVIE
ncbi:oxysterol-binding protein-related protein 11 isoform X3 [Hydra vulgaris]|uniref:Oxysterol-binding protein n=1 Tax=Hydra vulgaris TaxID=6087 RepID=A0ABM4BF21_HYDVU